MYLKHLTISGFKSFAKKSELEFSVPITSIVGPNGSGKSNVAEAFRFVLGEQSIKSMRGKKGEDLIFNGSDTVSRSNRAQVNILLDNKKRVFPMDFDEITIERTVHRDGQNEYNINNSKVRLKDVQELLSAANIGSTGHHIISQGEADRILSANAKERREMIEDALGLKVYQYKKLEAEKKLKRTRENVEKVQSLRREVAPHLKFLQRQVKKIERSLQLRDELVTVYLEYLRREDTYIAHHHDRLTKARIVPSKTLEELRDQLVSAKKILSESKHDAKSTELVSLQENIEKIRTQKQELLRKSGKLEGQISFLQRRIQQVQDSNSSASEAPIAMSEVSKVLSVVESKIDKAVKSTDAHILQRALTDIVHTLRTFIQHVSSTTTVRVDSEEKELKDIQDKQQETETRVSKVTKQEEILNSEYEDLKKSIEDEQSESRDAEREVFRIMGEQRECETEVSRLDQELQVLQRDRDEFKRELQEAVALIGSKAASYFSYEIIVDGAVLYDKAVVAEGREYQRERRRSLEKMKIRLEEMGGNNEDVEKEYKEVKERDEFLEREISDLEDSIVKLEELITELSTQLNEHFVEGIEQIGREFNRFFTLMFGGGEAKMIRVKPKVVKKKTYDEDGDITVSSDIDTDEEESIEEGIDLDVKLPNKRVSGLDMLSGGERALTSIALIFAMSQVNPPLFIILDETDAALDEANSRRYGDMIEALAEKSQLILITHNRETMSRAGILYGVTMGGDGVSKLLSVKFDEATEVAK